ncbi:hypothetical protein DBR06_SOUSAS2110044, partial [Sousa chinensis]
MAQEGLDLYPGEWPAGGSSGPRGPRPLGCQSPRPHRGRQGNSRARVGRLVALEGVGHVVLVVHVALRAEIVVEADAALPAHAPQPVLLAAVADNVGVADACGRAASGGAARPRPSARPRPLQPRPRGPRTDLGVVV